MSNFAGVICSVFFFQSPQALKKYDYFSAQYKQSIPADLRMAYNEFINILYYGSDPSLSLRSTLPFSIDIASDNAGIDRPLVNLINKKILREKTTDRMVKVRVVSDNDCYIVSGPLLSVCFIKTTTGKWLIYKSIMMYPI